jgi:ATP-dependent DNA ligase
MSSLVTGAHSIGSMNSAFLFGSLRTLFFNGPGWVYEIKLDGYRAIAVKSDRAVNLFSRRHKSFNNQYPYLVEALGELPEGTVVDGEVVALDDSGRPNFNMLAQFRRGGLRAFTISSSTFLSATSATLPDCH